MRLRPMMLKANFFYAVANGRQTGVFSSWEECKQQVSGFSKAKFKKFDSYDKAQNFLLSSGINIRNNNDTKRASNRISNKGKVEKPTTTASTMSGILLSSISKVPERPLEDSDSLIFNRKPSEPNSKETKCRYQSYIENGEVKLRRVNQDDVKKNIREESLKTDNTPATHYIYCDGASKSNGKPYALAGYGVFFGDRDSRNIAEPLKGKVQTNQRAELSAILRALRIIYQELLNNENCEKPPYYHIKTDSKYSINCIFKWNRQWIKNSWTNSKGQPVMNSDLIKDILQVLGCVNQKYGKLGYEDLKVTYVAGHSGDYGNDQADALANRGVEFH